MHILALSINLTLALSTLSIKEDLRGLFVLAIIFPSKRIFYPRTGQSHTHTHGI